MYRLTPEADADIEDIVLHIARDNKGAAWRWFDTIHAKFSVLGHMPQMGIARPEIRPALRTLPFGSYIIAYRATEHGVEIVRIIHGARKWQDLL